MKKISDKIATFMYGRYGVDETYYLLLALWFISSVLYLIFDGWIRWMLLAFQIFFIGFAIFRTMSKNIVRRRKENEWLRKITNKRKAAKSLRKSKKRDKATHIYCKCRKCKAVLRLPRVKGEHTAVCPKCHERIKVKVK